ncbi:MAG TPA: response regulator transcription factor [Stellaceae bacterium]|nr:response regulator transcription factor [Stellaceae bacterium]
MAPEQHLLVVDDDSRLRELLRRFLTGEGFRVTTAVDAAEARAKLESFDFDLLVVDVMMPGENGYDFTKSLRETSRIPILMLTAMAEPKNRIAGLERGADDYVVKPFEPRELVLRIRNILQRVPREEGERVPEIRFGLFVLDLRRRELRKGADPVRLTETELALLLALARAPGRAMTREDLSLAAELKGTVRRVDVQMTRLRRKIEADPRFPRHLQTVRGTGYVLNPD